MGQRFPRPLRPANADAIRARYADLYQAALAA
jgi:hypothetical protein